MLREADLQLPTCRNIRDLGGVRTRGGRMVRPGVLYRSGSLHHLDERDAATLLERVRPRTLIDLRTNEELDRFPVAQLATAAYLHAPFSTTGAREWMESIRRISLYDSYVGLTRSSASAIKQVFEALAEPRALPAIFFCAAGKDRTGIIAALLLSAMLVEDEDVIADYCLTAPVSPDDLGQGYAERLAQLPREFCEAPARTMQAFLEAIRREFGSTRAFLAMIGVDASLLRGLERSLLVD